MTMRRGQDVEVAMCGVLYSVKEFSVEDSSALENVTNTQGQCGGSALWGKSPDFSTVGYGSRLPGNRSARITLRNATFDDNENPFALNPNLGFSVHVGQSIPRGVKIYPNGINPGLNPWNFPGVLVRQMTHHGQIPGLQPITIHGDSDGAYEDPGQTTYGLVS